MRIPLNAIVPCWDEHTGSVLKAIDLWYDYKTLGSSS